MRPVPLMGKTKAASFRLATTVDRLCFDHYIFFFVLLFLCKYLIQLHQLRYTIGLCESLDWKSVSLHDRTVIVLMCAT